ncbi:beta-1,3-galactosyltransferase 2-like isoform X1 [Hippoglossus stenolepis]|uniref:beta-1,3-galactosyltransferase 2-like isoform X1 n=1 Tax=Hippoglossus stenolepis TaxID=195615 RepID=UPI00159CA49B|nr:beta-1,3-galactosyltransferase 2-like isoform X1 [Hippoglossus stenolepis]
MLESGCSMQESQGLLDAGRPADGRRWCSSSRRHCFCFILVFAAVYLLFYNRNLTESTTDWNAKWLMHYNPTKWWTPFKSLSQSKNFPNTTDLSSITRSPGAADGSTADSSSSVTDQATQNNSVPPLVPYVSPGPYLVEYPHQYHFNINEPQKCAEQQPFLVLMVPVAPHNRAHRDIVRSTWGGDSSVLGKVVKLFFLLGLNTGEGAEQLPEQLLQESKEHQDLIQSDFVDCYKNLTIKTMVMLEWLDSYCSSASYAMKIDSDMFLNLPNLINMLFNAPKTNYMTGLVANGGAVLRDPNSKWYVPVEIYSKPQYPRYALGLGYVLSLDLPKKLVEAAKDVRALYIEDVYLGLCMQHLGIPLTDPPDWGYFQVFPVHYSPCAFSKLIATTTHENADRTWMWADFKKQDPFC